MDAVRSLDRHDFDTVVTSPSPGGAGLGSGSGDVDVDGRVRRGLGEVHQQRPAGLHYLIRSLLLWMLGMITFWTTRVTAIFEVYFAFELLLSGRLLPVALMPDWVQDVAGFLPFESTFGFPITSLVGPITNAELIEGLLRQLMWIAIGAVGVNLMWRRGVKAYTAVNG